MDPFTNTQILSDAIPDFDGLNYEPLEKKYRSAAIVNSCIVFGLMIIATVLAYFFADSDDNRVFLAGTVVVTVLLIISILMVLLGYAKKQFIIREYDISYRKGVLWKSHITIPFNRVQHCEVNQGPIDRLYRIAKIKIYTAGGSTSDVTIPGLNPERAEKIKGFVLKQIAHEEEE